jgi:hypothetical protein
MLIAKLYSTVDSDEMIHVLNEIAEIRDPIFLYPLYETYKKNKNSHISHYFITTLNELDSNDVIQIAFEIGENPETKDVDRNYILEIFNKRKIYEQRAIDIAVVSLQAFISSKDTNEFDLYAILFYLENAGALSKIESELQVIFTNDKFNINSREYAFEKWLKIDPKRNLQSIIDNFSTIKQNDKLEYLIAKVISKWQGPKTEELKKIIEENGNIRAKNIIMRAREKDEEKKQKDIAEKQQAVQRQYSNADLVEKIIILREKINDKSKSKSKSNEHIGFSIFPQNEAIFLQLKTANDHATLIKACVGLRDIIQNLNDELGNHGLSIDEIKKLLPDTAEGDFNKSINKLFLFLHSKKFKIDSSVFELRELNQLVGLLGAHPVGEKDKLIKKLEIAKLDEAYREEEWATIHQSLLELYIKSLSALLKAISETN